MITGHDKLFLKQEDAENRRKEIELIFSSLKEIGDWAIFSTNDIKRWRGHYYAIKEKICPLSVFTFKVQRKPMTENKATYKITKKK
jgi:hypothetical protein